MKQYISYVLVSLLFAFMLMGCAHWGGDSPLGITGGSDGGYGENSDLNLPNPSNGVDTELLGNWRYNETQNTYSLFTFNSNGTFSFEAYYRETSIYGFSGDYSTAGDELTLNYNSQSVTISYSIHGNRLTLYFEEDTQTYNRTE